MTIAIYPGSFDPFTYGHLDIVKESSSMFDKVVIAISYNINKKGFLPIKVRKQLVADCVKDFSNVEVDCYDGLTVNYAKKINATVIIRGVRNTSDFEYEMQMAQANNVLSNEVKTVLLMAKPQYNFVSSSAVREILLNKGDITNFVPKPVSDYLYNL